MSQKPVDDQRATPPSAPPALVQAVLRVLRPLVRLLLTYGIQFPHLAEMLKGVFVEIATREFPVEGGRQTQSRISLLTGVHRKDVRRLMTVPADPGGMPRAVSLGVEIAGRWLSDSDLRDERGVPRPLPRLASVGGAQSFEGLVSRVSKDIRSRAVLDEWLRLGVVTLSDDDNVHLNSAAFVPAKGFDEKAFFLGQNIHDHLDTAVRNVIGHNAPRLERSVFYDGLSPRSVDELAELSQRLGMQTLVEINRRAAELQKRDAELGKTGLRMNFGLYFYRGIREELEHDNEK